MALTGAGPRVSAFLGRAIFAALLALIVLVAIPYGTVEPWSEALFESLVFLVAVLWIVDGFLLGSWEIGNLRLCYPLAALLGFAVLQSMALWQSDAGGLRVWYAISADPFESARFALKLGALMLSAGLLVRYAASKPRLNTLVHVVVGVGVASAIFGIVRQSTQHAPGFFLPFLKPGAGYGQFINKNHFAFLMEMAIGLVVGLMLMGGKKRERLPFYLATLLTLWTALVLSNSRGGIFAMCVQAICTLLLFPLMGGRNSAEWADLTRFGRFIRSFAARAVMVAMLLAIVAGGAIWIGGDPLAASLENASVEMEQRDTSQFREGARRRDIWRATWEMFKAHPLAGAGFGGYWAEIPKFHDASGLMTPQQAHNDYLEVLASGGLIGVGLFVWFAVALVKQARQALSTRGRFDSAIAFGAVIGVIGVAVHSIFDFGLHITANALIFFVLLAVLSMGVFDEKAGPA
jgi:O-antigen ligase